MSAAVELTHEGTGRRVQVLSRARLHQTCRVCGEDMIGCAAAAVQGARSGGRELGWFHLAHLSVVLMAAPAATERRLAGAAP